MSNFLSGIDSYLHRFLLIRKNNEYYSYNPTNNTVDKVTETGLTTIDLFKKYATLNTMINFTNPILHEMIPFDVLYYYDDKNTEQIIYTISDRPKIYDSKVNGYKGRAEIYVAMSDIPRNATEIYLNLDVENPYQGNQPLEMRIAKSDNPLISITGFVGQWIDISSVNSSLTGSTYLNLICSVGENQVLRKLIYNWR